ncbi:MAG: electron transport complex subunit RsxC [Ruminococcus sp.]|jgi:electron transport complex protein RnfC|nr:electron transport complex subunit RsxC [Ruminococcus sp.]
MKNLGGVKLPHNKNTANSETVDFGLPKTIVIPMAQAMGAVPNLFLKRDDKVLKGQIIGNADAFMSAPIHSPVSGDVIDISDYLNPNGSHCKAVTIRPDGLQTLFETVKPPEITDKKSFILAVRDSGLTGLGGAAFPTHVKFSYDETKTPIDTLIINGAECEPYITADNRCFLEDTDDIIDGIKLCMKYLNIKRCIISIEDNKAEAIALMREKTADMKAVEVKVLPSLYPQGAEKVIIYKSTGRIVMEGELPANAGVLVLNVSTVSFISKYCKTGIPLTSKRLTLDGSAIKKNRGNYNVLIGTPISELLEFGGAEDVKTILYGGPMMGVPLYSPEQPVLKSTNAILAFDTDISDSKNTGGVSACIRCGSCTRACPLNLLPMRFETAYKTKDAKMLKKLKLSLCMNCGCCSFACPAHRPLAEINQLAKDFLRNAKI